MTSSSIAKAHSQHKRKAGYADRQDGWVVVPVFDDVAISGAIKDRPGFDALVEFVARGECDVVLIEHLARRDRGDVPHFPEPPSSRWAAPRSPPNLPRSREERSASTTHNWRGWRAC
ncbi:recombinase family protein [Thioclava sp. GXIMD4215]|uniref:recombinase family protein n=1 Tax=Thioclava sp. GXIMD4215 TaxID=3131928 RepID=UPI003872CA9E